MAFNKNNKLSTILPQLNTFYWEINIDRQAISFDETAWQVFGEKFKLTHSIKEFIKLLDKESKTLFQQLLSNERLKDAYQLIIYVKSVEKEVSVILNGSFNAENKSIIEGIGFPFNLSINSIHFISYQIVL